MKKKNFKKFIINITVIILTALVIGYIIFTGVNLSNETAEYNTSGGGEKFSPA